MATGTGSVTTPSVVLAAEGFPGRFGSGEITVPLPSELASGLQGSAITGEVTAPAPDVNTPPNPTGRTGIGAVTPWVVGVLASGQSKNVITPSATVTASGVIGQAGTGGSLLSDEVVSAAGLHGIIGSGAVLTPDPEIDASSGIFSDITLHAPLVNISGVTGASGTAELFTHAASVTATLISSSVPGSEKGVITVSAPRVDGAGQNLAVISGAVTVSAIPTASGSAGTTGVGVITVPSMTVLTVSATDESGSVAISVPSVIVDAVGVTEVVTAVFDALAVNTRINSVTEYTGLTINSLTRFAGMDLAGTADGIVELAGTTDSGTQITASVRSGLSDLNSTAIKKIISGYVVMDADGDINMTLATDNKTERSYTLMPRLSGLHGAKIKFGLSVVGRHWQWGFDNQGNDFTIREIAADVRPSKRRIV